MYKYATPSHPIKLAPLELCMLVGLAPRDISPLEQDVYILQTFLIWEVALQNWRLGIIDTQI